MEAMGSIILEQSTEVTTIRFETQVVGYAIPTQPTEVAIAGSKTKATRSDVRGGGLAILA